MPDIIVFHTAWMDKYDGDRASLSAASSSQPSMATAMRCTTFATSTVICYGYVPPTGTLHFENHFSVPKNTEVLEGVTVVWTVPHPEQGGRAVIGVWRDAKVYRHDQEPTGALAGRRKIDREIAGYRCTAEAKNCVWLPPEARPIFVPGRQRRGGESWPGQQKVFYPKPKSQALRRLTEIRRDIDLRSSSGAKASSGKSRKPGHSGWQADVEKRPQIEVAAVKAVGLHLEGSGFTVQLVEKDNLGNDLVATRGDETLHVEVKGRSGRDVVAELSVNEFDCLNRYLRRRKPNEHYRIAIVTDALAKPVIHEFVMVRGRTSSETAWWTLDGQWRLQFEERKAARLTAERAQQ